MAKYTSDSRFTYTTEEVSREAFLEFIRSNDCYGLIRVDEKDMEWSWTSEDGLCFTDTPFDWEHFMDTDCIEPQCISEHLGTEGPEITEWNIIWSDDGYPIAQAVVGAWK